MRAAYLATLMDRDLAALERSIAAYPDDASLWILRPGLLNPGGTLALHLAGNLQHFVGAALGATGYVRDREVEFAARGLSREEVGARVADARRTVGRVLGAMPDDALEKPYPLPVGGHQLETGDFLHHLAVHLGYHLGQLDYHRRLVSGNTASVGAMAIAALGSARPAG